MRYLRAPIERLVVQEFDRIAVDTELLVDEWALQHKQVVNLGQTGDFQRIDFVNQLPLGGLWEKIFLLFFSKGTTNSNVNNLQLAKRIFFKLLNEISPNSQAKHLQLAKNMQVFLKVFLFCCETLMVFIVKIWGVLLWRFECFCAFLLCIFVAFYFILLR